MEKHYGNAGDHGIAVIIGTTQMVAVQIEPALIPRTC